MTKATKGNKQVVAAAADNSNKEVIQGVPTKADKARAVFDRAYGMEKVPQRKDIIAMAMTEAGLTKPGAATYLQNYKRKNGLSKPATPAA